MSFLARYITAITPLSPYDPNVLVSERFESGSQPSAWTQNGMGFNATPALAGNYSMAAAISNAYGGKAFPAAAANPNGYFLWRADTDLTGDPGMFELFGPSGRLVRLRARSTGAVRIYEGTDGSTIVGTSTSGLIVPDVTYRVWPEYITGTGANGQLAVYLSDTDTKPGSPAFSVATLTSTESPNAVRFPVLRTGNPVRWDDVLFKTVSIGSNPFA